MLPVLLDYDTNYKSIFLNFEARYHIKLYLYYPIIVAPLVFLTYKYLMPNDRQTYAELYM